MIYSTGFVNLLLPKSR